MRSRTFESLMILAFIVAAWLVNASASPAGEEAFLGRWDITAAGAKSGLPRNCWLELRRDKGVLKGRFNAGGGAVFDLPQITTEHGEPKAKSPLCVEVPVIPNGVQPLRRRIRGQYI